MPVSFHLRLLTLIPAFTQNNRSPLKTICCDHSPIHTLSRTPSFCLPPRHHTTHFFISPKRLVSAFYKQTADDNLLSYIPIIVPIISMKIIIGFLINNMEVTSRYQKRKHAEGFRMKPLDCIMKPLIGFQTDPKRQKIFLKNGENFNIISV